MKNLYNKMWFYLLFPTVVWVPLVILCGYILIFILRAINPKFPIYYNNIMEICGMYHPFIFFSFFMIFWIFIMYRWFTKPDKTTMNISIISGVIIGIPTLNFFWIFILIIKGILYGLWHKIF